MSRPDVWMECAFLVPGSELGRAYVSARLAGQPIGTSFRPRIIYLPHPPFASPFRFSEYALKTLPFQEPTPTLSAQT